MIRRGNQVASATGSRDCQCVPSASKCALARRTMARVLGTDQSPGQCSHVFRQMRKTFLISRWGVWDGVHQHWSLLVRRALNYVFAFCFAAQRAFINADNFFLAAALIGARLVAFVGADFPFHFAHRRFMATEIRLRAAALIPRRRGAIVGVALDLGGRPRRGADGPPSPSSAEIARLMRARSDLSSANMFSRFTRNPFRRNNLWKCSSRLNMYGSPLDSPMHSWGHAAPEGPILTCHSVSWELQ